MKELQQLSPKYQAKLAQFNQELAAAGLGEVTKVCFFRQGKKYAMQFGNYSINDQQDFTLCTMIGQVDGELVVATGVTKRSLSDFPNKSLAKHNAWNAACHAMFSEQVSVHEQCSPGSYKTLKHARKEYRKHKNASRLSAIGDFTKSQTSVVMRKIAGDQVIPTVKATSS